MLHTYTCRSTTVMCNQDVNELLAIVFFFLCKPHVLMRNKQQNSYLFCFTTHPYSGLPKVRVGPTAPY